MHAALTQQQESALPRHRLSSLLMAQHVSLIFIQFTHLPSAQISCFALLFFPLMPFALTTLAS